MRMKSRVTERAPGETEVSVTSDVNVVGVLAQFGRGMIQDVSDQLFQKFTTAMRRELETTAYPPAAAPAEAPPAESTASGAPSQAAPPGPVEMAAAPAPPPAPAADEAALDLGAIGAAAAGRAAGRTLSRPGFWIVVFVLALLIYWFFVRS
jgi:hypothetical protein